MTYQTHVKVAGLREISPRELEEVSGGQDNNIIVTGNRGDTWTVSITPDDLAILGIFNFGSGPSLPGTTQEAPGDGGSGGFEPDPGVISPEERAQALDADTDDDRQEAIERTLEAVIAALDARGADWTFEFDQTTGSYKGLSDNGSAYEVDAQAAENYYNSQFT